MADEKHDNRSRGGARGGAFRFRVSDSMEVPLRGHLLRLKLVEGSPSMKELGRGHTLRIVAPSGESRPVTIIGHSSTGGRATQERLDLTHELDVVIPREDAGEGGSRIGIGWFATGPAR